VRNLKVYTLFIKHYSLLVQIGTLHLLLLMLLLLLLLLLNLLVI